jgi:hypothetical protein
MNSKINTVVVTNVPVPYRIPGWQLIGKFSDIRLSIIFCSQSKIDSAINLDSTGFSSFFLQGKYREYGIRFFHNDISIWNLLTELQLMLSSQWALYRHIYLHLLGQFFIGFHILQ